MGVSYERGTPADDSALAHCSGVKASMVDRIRSYSRFRKRTVVGLVLRVSRPERLYTGTLSALMLCED